MAEITRMCLIIQGLTLELFPGWIYRHDTVCRSLNADRYLINSDINELGGLDWIKTNMSEKKTLILS